jgi:hypothetical protein
MIGGAYYVPTSSMPEATAMNERRIDWLVERVSADEVMLSKVRQQVAEAMAHAQAALARSRKIREQIAARIKERRAFSRVDHDVPQ